MYVLIAYDVCTVDYSGRRRLNKLAKLCVRYGQRVQNSVFECLVEPSELAVLKSEILKIMDTEQDSVRFYNLGDRYKTKIEHYGIKGAYEAEGELIL